MRDSLSIRLFSITRMGKLWGDSKAFTLDSDDLNDYSPTEKPRALEGRLLNADLGDLLRLKTREGVDVSFRGTHYKFDEVELDGSVKLQKLCPSEVGRA